MSSDRGFSSHVVAAIRAEMDWQGHTTRDLAQALSISPRAAQRRLTGDVDISLNELSEIAGWLAAEISELVDLHTPRQTATTHNHPSPKTRLQGLPNPETKGRDNA
ncbi:helix-turn-helix transcriptional regulator [Pseudoclavibacter sp. Z016]|uniref:helix-turn-helix domain-containing protein n=1 Tax=Pseudoclavibacter sp. Z016 TaxID=2080581 RepID=UPI0011AFF6C1|nr:helix-turn-helix transcriptional regulator [Pseudoclavibacter sp. Z016]